MLHLCLYSASDYIVISLLTLLVNLQVVQHVELNVSNVVIEMSSEIQLCQHPVKYLYFHFKCYIQAVEH